MVIMKKDVQYYLEQWPKNKSIDTELLSNAQLYTRAKSIASYSGELRRCKRCGIEQPITEFYFHKNRNGKKYRVHTCRDCILKADGVVEIGKTRFSMAILKKGFRRCCTCKNIKPLTEFVNTTWKYAKGKSFECYECSHNRVHDYQKLQKETVGDFYVRQYALRHYGVGELTDDEYEKYRNEILEGRKPKYFVDGLEFVTLVNFAEYIMNKYGVPITSTEARIRAGHSEDMCKLTEREFRKIAVIKWNAEKRGAGDSGRIRVTDTVTGHIFIFEYTRDPGLLAMFSTSAIDRAIKTGTKTRITKLSKYINPCIIERF